MPTASEYLASFVAQPHAPSITVTTMQRHVAPAGATNRWAPGIASYGWGISGAVVNDSSGAPTALRFGVEVWFSDRRTNPLGSPPSWQQFSAQAKDRLQITLEQRALRLRPPWYCFPGATRPSRPSVSPSSPAASSSCSPFPAPDQARLQQSWPSLFTQPVASASSRCRSVGRRAAAPASLAPARAKGGAGRLSLDSGQPVNTAAVLARFRRTDVLLHHLRDLPPTRGAAWWPGAISFLARVCYRTIRPPLSRPLLAPVERAAPRVGPRELPGPKVRRQPG